MLDVEAPYLYPAKYVLYVLVVTMIMTMAIIQFPIRRAARMKPGDALRYQ
jgi:ABC-type lipoprotein release transport system permease subunit